MSLTWLVALLSTCVVGSFMILHDAYLSSLGEDIWSLQRLMTHGWHVLIYFAIIFGMMYAILHKILVRPIHEMYVRIYALTKGDRQRIEINSPISEVQDIAEGINLLISRPDRAIDYSHAETLRRECLLIRSVADVLNQHQQCSRAVLLKCAARVEGMADEPPTESAAQ